MGPGIVLSVDTAKGAHVIQFDAMPTPRTVSFKTRLEKE